MSDKRSETRAQLIAMVELAEKIIPEQVDRIDAITLELEKVKREVQVWKQAHAAALNYIRNISY